MSPDDRSFQRNAVAAFIQIAALVIVVGICLRIVAPFVTIFLWATIIAVGLYPAHLALSEKLGGGEKRSATVLVIVALLVLLAPVWLLADSTITALHGLAGRMMEGSLEIPPPDPSVAEWPLIGGRVHEIWAEAASNLQASINRFAPQLETVGQKLLGLAGAAVITVLQFILSTIIAGALLVSADAGHRIAHALARNLTEDHGAGLVDMSIATIRSVAKGVLGVAVIQALASALGLVMIGVPAAGLWAFLILILAIVQLPPLLILGPIIVWVFSVNSGISATIFAVYAIVVSASDSFLKPMLLGRGMDLPMLVLLLGAIGGASTMGIIGLFIGAVVLAVGYKILAAWPELSKHEASPPTESEASD